MARAHEQHWAAAAGTGAISARTKASGEKSREAEARAMLATLVEREGPAFVGAMGHAADRAVQAFNQAIGQEFLSVLYAPQSVNVVPLGTRTIERAVDIGKFPRPCVVGRRRLWRESDVQEWISRQEYETR